MSEYVVKSCDGIVSDCHVYDLDESVRASKYPMAVDHNKTNSEITDRTKSLGRTGMGEGHDNFLSGIVVNFDLTITNKMWVEAERYHFFQIVSSQSTMHRISKIGENRNNFDSHVDPRTLSILNEKIAEYNRLVSLATPDDLNVTQKRDELLKEAYLDILMNVPAGLKLTARISTNYRQLKTIYYQRKNHRLPEWRKFCNWMETELPHFKELCLNAQ